MTRDLMDERRNALEDEFFHKEDTKKLEVMKDKLAAQATKEELRKFDGAPLFRAPAITSSCSGTT